VIEGKRKEEERKDQTNLKLEIWNFKEGKSEKCPRDTGLRGKRNQVLGFSIRGKSEFLSTAGWSGLREASSGEERRRGRQVIGGKLEVQSVQGVAQSAEKKDQRP
jgi:hypothetical protein